jgi:hypothetical protein
MLKQALLCAFIAGTAAAGPAETSDTQATDYTHVFIANEVPFDTTPTAGLLATIAGWIIQNFDLPAADAPKIELASPAQIAALRYRGLLPQMHPMPASDQTLLGAGSSVVAVYDSSTQTIFLPEGWTGQSPAEQSVLVHEIVHHLQNRGQLRFNCPEEREKVAYEAQERWLSQFGTSLEQEFEIDRFSLLVRVNCIW